MRGTVLITGASSGIGAALATEFARHDFDLILTARTMATLEAVRETLPCSDDQVSIITADLASTSGVDSLIADIPGPLDVLVNNAGNVLYGLLSDQNASDVEQLMALNMVAMTRLTHHYLPQMLARNSGMILNVASIAAFQSVPGMDLYAASKAYVLSLSESLAEQLRGTGVSVTALCPGVTRTPATGRFIDELPDFLISSPDAVAEAGFRALMNGDVISVPGLVNQGFQAAADLPPRAIVRRALGLASKLGSLLGDIPKTR